jgi:hypothetical protein
MRFEKGMIMGTKIWLKASQVNHEEFLRRARLKGKLQTQDQVQDFLALAICGEAGELGNIHKKRMRGDDIEISTLCPDEAADIYIYLHHYAKEMGFCLDGAARRKVDIVSERLKNTH